MAKGVSTLGTTSQQLAKLRSRGFIAFEIDGAIGRLTKVGKGKAPRSAMAERRLITMARFAATYLAHIKRRAMRGDLATQASSYSTAGKTRKGGRPSYVVAQAYSERTDAGKENWGDSSADWHRKAGSVPGNTTGLMWRGAQAVASGRTGARMEFGGSSIGTSSVARIRRRETRKGTRTTARIGKRVRNRGKATAVYNALGVNVLQPKTGETQAGADLWMASMYSELVSVLDLRKASARGTTGDRRLYAELTRQLRRRAGRG